MSQSMFSAMADQILGTPWAFVLAANATSILDIAPGQDATAFRALALAKLLEIQAARTSRGSDAAFVAKTSAVALISEIWTSAGGAEPADSRTASQLNALVPAAV